MSDPTDGAAAGAPYPKLKSTADTHEAATTGQYAYLLAQLLRLELLGLELMRLPGGLEGLRVLEVLALGQCLADVECFL